MNIQDLVKRNAPTILTVLAAIGTIVTAVLAVKATPMALEKIEEAAEEKQELTPDQPSVLTRTETVAACWTCYIPAVSVGISTILCLIGANAMNLSRQASLANAFSLLQGYHLEYKDKVIKELGEEAGLRVEEALARDREEDPESWDQTRTFYLHGYNKLFERSKKEVFVAFWHMNRNIMLGGTQTMSDFLEFLGIEGTEKTDNLAWEVGKILDYLENRGFADLYFQPIKLADGMVCEEICFDPDPFDLKEVEAFFEEC